MNASLIPTFDFQRVIIDPWTTDASVFGWIFLMGFFVTAACGLVGNYLILRRIALMGDAVSHSILPGLVIAFLLTQTRGTWVMFLGALAAGAATTIMIEAIHRRSRVKQDSAIGITFTTLFAIGVILISVFAQQVDLDADCVLYGEIAFVPLEPFTAIAGMEVAPPSVLRMGGVLLVVIALIVIFYKELLVSSFDSGLAASLGISPTLMHYGLMAALSVVIVSAFEAVGAILVIAMLILPGATSFLLTQRLSTAMILSVVHAALSSLLGIHLAIWLNCSVAAAMVVMGAVLFVLAWVFGPDGGLVARALHRRGRHTLADPSIDVPSSDSESGSGSRSA